MQSINETRYSNKFRMCNNSIQPCFAPRTILAFLHLKTVVQNDVDIVSSKSQSRMARQRVSYAQKPLSVGQNQLCKTIVAVLRAFQNIYGIMLKLAN